ncbi:hypothetical protein BN1356_00926 [Streptococcus varani]|uniref:Uncharacterized protein n=1 Tax=Streptococcus varani TaxID=1608583 RepID=A0A0E4CSI6_9STRE|nr:hypothetical protein [Streptococcus varani]CQR24582.1 hypothetical protein BN1356_00926 [Streptococcus varani]
MKVKVNNPFRDLKESVVRRKGEEFEVDDERFNELETRLPGFVEPVLENSEKKKSKKTKVEEDGTA